MSVEKCPNCDLDVTVENLDKNDSKDIEGERHVGCPHCLIALYVTEDNKIKGFGAGQPDGSVKIVTQREEERLKGFDRLFCQCGGQFKTAGVTGYLKCDKCSHMAFPSRDFKVDH